jgi:hypothetical protein
MSHTFFRTAVALALTLGATAVYAQTPPAGAAGTPIQPQIHDARQNIRDERLDRKADVKEMRQDIRDDKRMMDKNTTTPTDKETVKRLLEQRLNGGIKERNQEAKEQIQGEREKIKDLRDERKERRKDEVRKRVENVTNRMAAFIERLKDIAKRINARIVKLEGEGKNMTTPKNLLVLAQGKITVAETDLGTLRLALAAIASSTEPITKDELVHKVKDASEKTKESIKVAHQALVDVITSIKPGQNKPKATTTPPVGTSTPTTP